MAEQIFAATNLFLRFLMNAIPKQAETVATFDRAHFARFIELEIVIPGK